MFAGAKKGARLACALFENGAYRMLMGHGDGLLAVRADADGADGAADDFSEALDIGLYEYFDSGCFCFIEWPEMIEELLPEDTLKVRITILDESTRKLQF